MCETIHRVCLFPVKPVCPLQDLELFSHDQTRKVGKRKTIVIVAEGAHDTSLKPILADHVKNVLVERLGLDTRVTTLGHTQRGGRPCAYDRIMVCYAPTEL